MLENEYAGGICFSKELTGKSFVNIISNLYASLSHELLNYLHHLVLSLGDVKIIVLLLIINKYLLINSIFEKLKIKILNENKGKHTSTIM